MAHNLTNGAAISGVASDREGHLAIFFPTIAATSLGAWIGRMLDRPGTAFGRVHRAHLLLALPLAPLASFLYLWLKVFGPVYALTNRRLIIKRLLLAKPIATCDLATVDRVQVNLSTGCQFLRSGDLRLLDQSGQVSLVLKAIPYPQQVARQIEQVRLAQQSTQLAQAHLLQRPPLGQKPATPTPVTPTLIVPAATTTTGL